ncbi:MAG: hypothetical protein Q7J13_15990 [Brevundimonas sp.]|uniref:hypothetical protein n=1 Tax=Brevundimonas sp. TaxID=1871086 RepID=UPI00271B7B59|nr:hypothetical protein [Brevundimonas sp.]MDO9589411.1 hypothetical protein [Brevundimonas sp.]
MRRTQASLVLPLQIYGPDRYAVRQAMVLTPVRYLQAVAPAAFALALDASVALALVLSSAVCLAMLPLNRPSGVRPWHVGS